MNQQLINVRDFNYILSQPPLSHSFTPKAIVSSIAYNIKWRIDYIKRFTYFPNRQYESISGVYTTSNICSLK